ncbi:hypothetical protein C8F04DRAFT_958139, partial [Mycena alexandri]
REEFLAAVLFAEGRGVHRDYTVCPGCKSKQAEYRCKTCLLGGQMLCESCMVERHRAHPFHSIQKRWTGSWFAKTTLKQMGLCIQLGHWVGDPRCPVPTAAAGDDFVIVGGGNSVHEVGLDFCGCGRGGAHTTQLLRAGLYPATVEWPRTAATFEVLDEFQLLSYESKCSAYEFYHALARGTDNTGLRPAKDRYHEFLRMTRQWGNLEMLRRFGRGHAPDGPAGTKAGECALLCPACPHPGKNLPPQWKEMPENRQFLYALFLAIDANFRLKRKDVSSEEADPGLTGGWAFYCEVQTYMAHLAEHWDKPQERSTCVAHDAVDKPDREARGTASSGIGAVDCARHNMKRPSAVGDLQFGERYINMDYMFFRSVAGTDLIRLYVSYDIACQWHKKIWERMEGYDAEIHFEGEGKFVTFLVPKFHLPAHIEECNLRYSFNLTPNVGQTDGEAPERGWANANPLASSTAEMGPGSRRDKLNHFNDVNHKKIIGLGGTMLKKVTNGVPVMVEMQSALREMEASLAAEALGVEEGPVATWTQMATNWEANADSPNPFEMVRKDDHLAKVRHDLAVEAAKRERDGIEDMDAVRDGMHVTEVIAMGLQLEEQQRTLRFDASAAGLHPTKDQSRTMVERTSKVRRKILAWIDIQRGFFPVVDSLREHEDHVRARVAKTQPIPGVQAYDIALWMPSAIAKAPGWARRQRSKLLDDALDHEYRLRVGQANEALDEMRRNLLVRTYLYNLKDAYSRGVRDNMRSGAKIEICDDRIRRMAAQYRAAREALVALGQVLERNEWERTLKPLADADVRGMPRATARVVKAPTTVSWIWMAQARLPEAGESAAMNEALRIEWAKARARALRWTEEIDLLEEEMRRIRQFLVWRSEWWMDQVESRGLAETAQLEGETAYALRQAVFHADLCERFATMWVGLPELIRRGREAASNAEETAPSAAGVDESEEEDGEDGEDDDEGARPVPVFAGEANPLYFEVAG